MTLHTRDYFHSIYRVPLVYISVLMPVPNCFDYFIFVVFEVTKCESSVLLFSKIDLDIWSSLRIHINFRIFFLFLQKSHGTIERDCIEMENNLSSILKNWPVDIRMVLISAASSCLVILPVV